MADRSIKILQAGRAVVQGVANLSGELFEAVQAQDDILTYLVSFLRWLDGATISSATIESNGLTVSSTSTTTSRTLTVSGVGGRGDITLTITASDGRVKEIIINFVESRLDG